MKIQWKKMLCSIIIGIILIGEINIPVKVEASSVNQSNENLQSNTDIYSPATASVLGVLEQKVTQDEFNTVNDLISKINLKKANRRCTNNYIPTEEEQGLITQLSSYLDGLTLKYIDGAKQALENGPDFDLDLDLPENNAIIKNLKQTLTNSDYKKLTSLYNQYRTENKEATLDKIYSILSKYESLDADAVFKNIFRAKMLMKGQFKINHNDLSIQSLNPKKYGLTQLSDKQMKQYKKVWAMVKQILPSDYFGQFVEFDIFTDGKGGAAAYVTNMDHSGKTWKLCIDPADIENELIFSYYVIHEYSHYVSLNSNQVKYFDVDQSLMPSFSDYTDDDMVANTDSYLNAFYQEFWASIMDDRSADMDNVLFYVRHYDEFVNAYAATKCSEDFAVMFSIYVLGLGEDVMTAEEKKKIDFFDQYPELKQIKQQILENMEKNNYDVAVSD